MFKYILLVLLINLHIFANHHEYELDPNLKNLAIQLLQESNIDSLELVKMPETFPSFAAILTKFSPSGFEHQMILNEKLLKALTEDEQCFVILHEIGHLKDNPAIGLMTTFAPPVISILGGLSYFLASGKTIKNSCVSIGIAAALYGTTKLIGSHCARASELRADLYAYRQQKNLKVACSALSKRDTVCKTLYPTSGFKRLFEDHPSVEERIAYLQNVEL